MNRLLVWVTWVMAMAIAAAACGDDAAPATGVAGGPCYGNGTCDAELVCDQSMTCVNPNGPSIDAAFGPDAASRADADPDAPDANPNAPDADPAPDANPNAPDALASDAAGGSPDARPAPDATVDPCAGVTCGLPPAPRCVSDTVRRAYTGPGECVAGECVFASSDETCADACSGGACVDLSCDGDTCDDPPGDACVSGQELGAWAEVGACELTGCEYQQTVSTCTEGCAGVACAPGSWLLTELATDTSPSWTSIAVDTNGRPHIAYLEYGNLFLYALTPTGWVRTPIDTDVGSTLDEQVLLEIDAAGGVHVAYSEPINENVRYAYRAPGAATFVVEFVASTGDHRVLALAVDPEGVPHVAYRTAGEGIRVARKTTSTWPITHTLVGGSERMELHLALRADGAPVIAYSTYRVSPDFWISSAVYGVPTGDTWTTEPLPATMAVNGLVYDDASGGADVLLSDVDHMVAAARTAAGTWTTTTLRDGRGNGIQGALARGADGSLWAMFIDGAALVVANKVGDGWSTEAVDDTLDYDGRRDDIAVDADGTPHLAIEEGIGSSDLYYVRPAP